MSKAENEVAGIVLEEEQKPQAETRTLEAGVAVPPARPRQAETRKLGSEPDSGTRAVAPGPHLGLTREEMSWAAVAHGSVLVTVILGLGTGGLGVLLGVAIPAVIWYLYRNRSAYVVDQARQATIFQLAGIVALLVLLIAGGVLLALGWAVSGVLVTVLIGLLLIPFALILTLVWVVGLLTLPIAQVVYGCYAAIEAYNGRPFRYRWIGDLIDRYQAQL